MPLRDRKVIVTAGPTREWLDPVRFISNPSSGRMGIALADSASRLARETVLVHGPVSRELLRSKKYRTVAIESTADLLNAVKGELTDGAVLIMAAAPADYRPAIKSEIKMKKTSGNLTLELARTPDILKQVSRMNESGELNNLFLVGFAAETTNVEQYAKSKLKEKNLDMICLNDVSRKGAGFGGDTNVITMFMRGGRRVNLEMMTKRETAEKIIAEIQLELSPEPR